MFCMALELIKIPIHAKTISIPELSKAAVCIRNNKALRYYYLQKFVVSLFQTLHLRKLELEFAGNLYYDVKFVLLKKDNSFLDNRWKKIKKLEFYFLKCPVTREFYFLNLKSQYKSFYSVMFRAKKTGRYFCMIKKYCNFSLFFGRK